MKTLLFTGAIMAAFVAGPVMAAGRCDDAHWQKAADASEKIKTWPQLHAFYSQHGDCAADGGYIAEGISDEVAKLMAYRWSGVAAVRDPLRGEKGFATFVLNHIDATWDWDDFPPARDNVVKRCPAGLETFCAAAVREIDRSNKESHDLPK